MTSTETPNTAPDLMQGIVTGHLVITTHHQDSVGSVLHRLTADPRSDREALAAIRRRNQSAWANSGPARRRRG